MTEGTHSSAMRRSRPAEKDQTGRWPGAIGRTLERLPVYRFRANSSAKSKEHPSRSGSLGIARVTQPGLARADYQNAVSTEKLAVGAVVEEIVVVPQVQFQAA
ncbi:hypothetical protein [Rhodococcoides fascians]|uniref:hypothetical protein n=1 Tax=Rhodococcoides fascians TaxID=1828 RepID=UPI00050C9EBD|nr:hypothetical protein [Rhodococcus fascians]